MSFIPQMMLALFILNLSVALGAGLYEARIVIPRWFPRLGKAGHQVDSQAIIELDSGRKFWAFVTTGPLTILTLVNLILAWQSELPGYYWWLTAALITLVERVSTFSFFIPTVIKLQASHQLPARKLHRLTTLWISLNYVRNLLTLLGWLFALKAFAFVE